MWQEIWAPVLGAITVAVVGLVLPLLNLRNQRAVVQQELDILKG